MEPPPGVELTPFGAWIDAETKRYVKQPGVSEHDRQKHVLISPHSKLRDRAAAKRAFLDAYRQCHRKTIACKAAHVSKKWIELCRQEDPDFAEEYEEINSGYVEFIEDNLEEIALEEKGMARFSATAMILNAEASEKYKRAGVGEGGAGREMHITVTLQPQPLPEWEKPKLTSGVADEE